MPEWLLLVILFVVLRNVIQGGSSCRPRALPHGRGTTATRAPELPRPDPVTELQRAWVNGRITDEEYESALDRVYRKQQ